MVGASGQRGAQASSANLNALNKITFLKVEGRNQLEKEIEETMKAADGNEFVMIHKDVLKDLDMADALRYDSFEEIKHD